MSKINNKEEYLETIHEEFEATVKNFRIQSTIAYDDFFILGQFIEKKVSGVIQAFGGCFNCFGKGYRSQTTDGGRMEMRFCTTCDRGKALQRLLAFFPQQKQ